MTTSNRSASTSMSGGRARFHVVPRQFRSQVAAISGGCGGATRGQFVAIVKQAFAPRAWPDR
jgi:hypothetical protein